MFSPLLFETTSKSFTVIPYFQHPNFQTTPTNKNIKLHKLRIQSISQTTNVIELASHKFNISALTSIMKNHVHL